MIVAAVALLTAPAAHAQLFVPSGPTVGTPLGGGVLRNIGFGSGLNTGFGSFNLGFNSGVVLPLNANFNSQLASFNDQRTINPNLVDFNAQLANFNANRTSTNQQFSALNSALNVPSANFAAPNPLLFPNTQGLVTSGFNQINPTVNPFVINGPVSGSIGFSGFNTFNPLSGAGTGFGGSGIPATAQLQNITRVTRARPAYNPTLPNPPASQYPSAALLATGAVPSHSTAMVNPTWIGPYGPLRRTNPLMDIQTVQRITTAPVGMTQTAPVFSPTWPNNVTPTWIGPYGTLRRTNPLMDSVGVTRAAFGSGLGAGSVVMGARSAR